MSEVIFNYKGEQTIIQCQQNSKMKDICQNYSVKISKDISNLVFLYNGTQLKEDLNFIELANKFDKERNKMAILVTENNNTPITPIKKNQNNLAKEILCPECNEPIKIKLENYKVKLSECKNGHKNKILLLSEFKQQLFYDESKIICDLCKKLKNLKLLIIYFITVLLAGKNFVLYVNQDTKNQKTI